MNASLASWLVGGAEIIHCSACSELSVPRSAVVLWVAELPISVDDKQRLSGLNWLTDNIINAYAQLLRQEVDDGSTIFFPSLLFTNLMLGQAVAVQL